MMPKGHLICGIALAIVLWMLGIGAMPIFVILCASILIDLDHVLNYIAIFKRCNPIEIYTYFRRNAILKNSIIPLPVFIFHNLETLFILAVFSWFFPFIIYILAGVIFHMALDWSVMPTYKYPAVIKLSLILVIIENKRRKRGFPKW